MLYNTCIYFQSLGFGDYVDECRQVLEDYKKQAAVSGLVVGEPCRQ